MTIEGVDYSWARPDPVKLYAAGIRFACRYTTPPTRVINGITKNLTRVEADALRAAGVAIVSNWEYAPGDATGGRVKGAEHAAKAHDIHTACGGPETAPIYFSVDFDIRALSAADLQQVRDYFAGVRSVIGKGRTGIYGGYHTVRYALNEGWASWFWQTYGWSIWTDPDGVRRRHWHDACHIRQVNNGETVAGTSGIDLDEAMTTDYGQWGVDDMAFTSAQEATLLTAASAINTYLLNMAWRIAALEDGVDVTGGGGTKGQPFWVNRQLKAIAAQLGQIDEATAAALTTKLDAILAAAQDDGDVSVQLPPDAITALQEIKAAITAVPGAVADEQAARLAD